MPSCGHVIRGTPIAVDLWDTRSHPQAKLFFLTHYHADHIVGLTDAWHHPIYTSIVTGMLLSRMIGVKRSLIHPLELEEEHLIPLDAQGKEMASVTFFDANHCPGAVMILFRGYFGNVLYTGDFRYKEDILDFSSLPDIDTLYLDNTYCSPKCTFPSYEDAVDAVLQKLHSCLQRGRRVFLGLDGLGKEDLLTKISRETHKKIWVNPERRKILGVLQETDFLAGEDRTGEKILVVPFNQVSGLNVDRWNSEAPSCAILPTARFCGYGFNPYNNRDNIHVILLSNHSSYSELMEFVRRVCPRSIIPIVGKTAKGLFGSSVADRADMSVFGHLLDDSPCTDFEVPPSVQRTMRSSAGLKGVPQSQKRRPDQSPPSAQVKRLHVPPGVTYINGGKTVPDKDEQGGSGLGTKERQEAPPEDESLWEVVHVFANGKVEKWEAPD